MRLIKGCPVIVFDVLGEPLGHGGDFGPFRRLPSVAQCE